MGISLNKNLKPDVNLLKKYNLKEIIMKEIEIREAVPADASKIAEAIMEAVGREITLDFAGGPERLPLVKEVFTELAQMPDSQYSYRNTLIAETSEGEVAGVAIAYDGALLHQLREKFAEAANRILGMNLVADEMADETSDDEIYLDTLCVFEPWRRKGIASRLIDASSRKHLNTGKPLGLLVDKDNSRARSLYIKNGFRYVDDRPFAGVMMDHMQILD